MTTKRHNLGDQAHAQVRTLLLNTDRWQAGEQINVIALAEELGVSRSPLWDAIARLEAEGLLEVRPRRGVFVVRHDEARLADIRDAREALEGMAARQAAIRASMTDVDALTEILKRQEDCMRRADAPAYAEAALAFHRLVLRIAGNDLIGRMLEALYAQTRTMCRGLPASDLDLADRHADHAQLIAAICARDPDRAEAVARAHVRRLSPGR